MVNKKLLVVLLIFGVAAIAVVAATAIPLQRNAGVVGNVSGSTKVAPSTNSAVVAGSNGIDIKQLLTFDPGPNATPDKLKEFSAKVAGASVDAPFLDITKCSPSPSVYRVKFGQSFTVKNSDKVAHKLMSDKVVILQADANSDKQIKPNFDKGAGIYGYSCEGNGTVGLFFVTQ